MYYMLDPCMDGAGYTLYIDGWASFYYAFTSLVVDFIWLYLDEKIIFCV